MKSCFISVIPAAILICLICLTGSSFLTNHHEKRASSWRSSFLLNDPLPKRCKEQCRPYGTEALPKGIVSRSSNLEMQPLWGSPKKKTNATESKSLLTISVGIKQKHNVDQIVRKFLSSEFTVMLFHYDGVVDEWSDLPWSEKALHISAINQTKWWFAKRFLHPDIVAEYKYIFVWDEDIGVEKFHPRNYLSIIEEEGLEISQPALDPTKSQVHHQITMRGRRGRVHRRIFKQRGSGRCYANSTEPPCTGWVEMMVPVFSRSAWRCAWYMIQNDLIHAWGLDKKLGYCAQGDRSKKIGIVDSEYIVHYGLPTLGSFDEIKPSAEAPSQGSQSKSSAGPALYDGSGRLAVRQQSFMESEVFTKRWQQAVDVHDECWKDLYPPSKK